MSAPNPAEVIAEALGRHYAVSFGVCLCGWKTGTKLGESWRPEFDEHQASVIAALPDIAIVPLPSDPGGHGDLRWSHWTEEIEEAFHEEMLRELRRIHAVSVAAARAAGGES